MKPNSINYEMATTPKRMALGIESEFLFSILDAEMSPEDYWGEPDQLFKFATITRTGKAISTPLGGAAYFDNGVIEIATPLINLEGQSALRVARSHIDHINLLNHWFQLHKDICDQGIRLSGFSTHYNISVPSHLKFRTEILSSLAKSLLKILFAPLLLLATNAQSTGIGVRNRGDRLEITIDFSPHPDLFTVTMAAICGIAYEIMHLECFDEKAIEQRYGISLFSCLAVVKHTSRTGWMVKSTGAQTNPFVTAPSADIWLCSDNKKRSLASVAAAILASFRVSIIFFSSVATFEKSLSIILGNSPALNRFGSHPAAYTDISLIRSSSELLCNSLQRASYERVAMHVANGHLFEIRNQIYVPEKIRGWLKIDAKALDSAKCTTFTLDDLAETVVRWYFGARGLTLRLTGLRAIKQSEAD